jgi:NifU-like protein involved in Fe-S cluster formation
VRDLFEHAMRRGRVPAAGEFAEAVCDAEGNRAAFRVVLDSDRIRSASYRCTTCVTLVALCEYLVGILPGMNLAAARDLTPQMLLAALPEIPTGRRGRAELVLRALRAAVAPTRTVSL